MLANARTRLLVRCCSGRSNLTRATVIHAGSFLLLHLLKDSVALLNQERKQRVSHAD
jgi:hypothetical protein